MVAGAGHFGDQQTDEVLKMVERKYTWHESRKCLWTLHKCETALNRWVAGHKIVVVITNNDPVQFNSWGKYSVKKLMFQLSTFIWKCSEVSFIQRCVQRENNCKQRGLQDCDPSRILKFWSGRVLCCPSGVRELSCEVVWRVQRGSDEDHWLRKVRKVKGRELLWKLKRQAKEKNPRRGRRYLEVEQGHGSW